MLGCAWLIGCAPGAHPPPVATTGDAIALYRDRALIEQRVELDVPASGTARVAVALAAGIRPEDLVVVDRGSLVVRSLWVGTAAASAGDRAAEPAAPVPAAPTPTEVEIVVGAPRAGRFALTLGYATDQLAWQVAYTITTSPARDRATVRGALAIHNTTGVALRGRVSVIDRELGTRDLRTELTSGPPAGAPRRELGVVALGDGDTRIELLAGTAPRALRSVLIYDPIGSALDHPGAAPISDPALGVATAAPTRVTESLEVDRDEPASRGLPAGPVRLVERRDDGSLAVLGESRIAGDAPAGLAPIAIGTAHAVAGHRERRDWARDDDQKRFSEEFLITVDNARPSPIDIVLREHLYRGQNWTLAYQSAPAAKEGPQQISLRTTVPANGHAKVLYVVVYTW
jgi:hypothetical protein